MDFKDKEELDEFIVKLGDHPRNWMERLPPEAREVAKRFDLLQRDLAEKFDGLIEKKVWNCADVVEALENYGICDTGDFIFAFWEPPIGNDDFVGENHFKTALSFSGDGSIDTDIVEELIERVLKPLYEFYAFWMCFKSLNGMLPDSYYSLRECRRKWYYGYGNAATQEWRKKMEYAREQFKKAEKLHASILKIIGGEPRPSPAKKGISLITIENEAVPPKIKKRGRL